PCLAFYIFSFFFIDVLYIRQHTQYGVGSVDTFINSHPFTVEKAVGRTSAVQHNGIDPGLVSTVASFMRVSARYTSINPVIGRSIPCTCSTDTIAVQCSISTNKSRVDSSL